MKRIGKNLFSDWRINNTFLVILLAVAVFTVYANTFGNGMFWDDNDFILNNVFIRSWQYMPNWFSQNVVAGSGLVSNYWRPVLLAVFSLEWHAWQAWTPGYHIVNACFHLADGILLFYLFFGIFRRRGLAFFAALVFLLHPVQTEAVSYANSLGDSLSVFFMFLGLGLFLSAIQNPSQVYYKNWRYYASVLLFPLALMSKETAIIMPALAGLVWIFASKKDILTGIWQKTAELIKILGLFLIVAAVYIFLRATILNFGSTFNLYGTNANLFSSNVGVRIITFFRIFTDYLGLLFWPARLHMERSVEWAASFAHLDVIFGVALFIAVLSLAIWKLRKKSPLSFGLLWFLIGLSPTSNIAVPINGLLYEHWLYLPLAGFALAFGDAFWSLLQKVGKRNWIYFAAGGMVFIITAAMAARSIARNFDWRDPVVFYTQTLAFAPNDYKLLNNLGMEYAGRQDLVNAAKYYNLAINIQPDVAVAYYNLGNLLLAQNQEQKALEKYVRALEVDPKFLYAYPPVIEIYSQEGNKEMAQKYYQQYSGIIRGK